MAGAFPLALDADTWRLMLAAGTFLAVAHAYQKLSPYFALAWFGSALVFAYAWSGGRTSIETLLLPGLVIYLAAAITKGLVESRSSLAGNHVVHVLVAAPLTGIVALPFLASARAMGWEAPASGGGEMWGLRADWLGGVSPEALVVWSIAGLLFYGLYKVLDHTGLNGALQTLLLFGAMPFLPRAIAWVRGLV